ncbi:hypothetical protein GQR58_007643 [Nymphon striatum]|nr:hypothetical protein GQR58_007643 [Nymphon striatum]
MPACAEVNNAMQLLTGVNYNTGEQNKDIAIDRQVRDMKDTHTIISYLQERTPFSSDPSLGSISTGVRATSTVNVDSAKTVGTAILTNMDGQTATDYKFKRKDQAITLAAKSAVKIDDQVHYVLDGGALVQRIPWARGSTYKGICRQYTEYVTKKYGQATVVFDGYGGASTKNTTHQRRMRGNAGATVMFDEDMQVTMKKPKKNVKKPRVWNMKYVKQQLGPDVSQHIFFMHALLGCDITSQVYDIGKGASLKKFKTSAHFRDQSNVFDRQAASTDDVIEAGEKALACLYNGNPGESLNVVRHKRFCQKVAFNTSHVQPQSLRPTSAAAKHHSLRVYYQVQQWKGIAANELRPCDWGWQKSSSGLVPVQTDLPPAPKELLKMIRCNCQTDCSSLKCTCKKHDIECSAACVLSIYLFLKLFNSMLCVCLHKRNDCAVSQDWQYFKLFTYLVLIVRLFAYIYKVEPRAQNNIRRVLETQTGDLSSNLQAKSTGTDFIFCLSHNRQIASKMNLLIKIDFKIDSFCASKLKRRINCGEEEREKFQEFNEIRDRDV